MNNSNSIYMYTTKRKNENEETKKENKIQKLNKDFEAEDQIGVDDKKTVLLSNEYEIATSSINFDTDDLIIYSPESDFYDEESDGNEDKLEIKKEIFLQNDTCFNISFELPQCRECKANPLENKKYSCRFFQFRKIERDNVDNRIVYRVVGFLDKYIDTQLADFEIWSKPDNRIKIPKESINYILRCVASQFCEMVRDEIDIYYTSIQNKENTVAWKRSIYLVREMCDTCSTSIFNFHFTCKVCGSTVCLDCYRERFIAKVATWKSSSKAEKEERDKFFWLKCHNDEEHSLILTQMIPGDSLTQLNERMHKTCDENFITLFCECRNKTILNTNPKQSISIQQAIAKKRREKIRISIIRPIQNFQQSFQVQHKWIAQKSVLKLMEPSESNYDIFQSQWERGKPVVVANVKKNMRDFIWKPEYLSYRFGNNKHSLVNCKTDTVIKNVKLNNFFDGFKSYKNRLPIDVEDKKLILKLKDWPNFSDFADVMRDHYEDMMKSVPFLQYTRRDGFFNLPRYLHEHFLKADLGPKIYCAYANSLPLQNASTNLHLDISDAINILLHVSQPEDAYLSKDQYGKDDVIQALEAAGCDSEDINAFTSGEKLPGAIWYIWHASKVEEMRKVLNDVAQERGKKMKQNDDCLHDQDVFIDFEILERLKQNKIEAYTIVQYESDGIFIPAGSPHMVTNIFDCIKIALDFVSPENITECFNLTSEFRKLSTKHANREDKLQIKSILYHTIKNLVPPKNENNL